jgi:hypothetical protein
MNHSIIQNSQVLQFKTIAKNFTNSGFQPQGYALMGHDAQLELAVFHGADLPANLLHALDVALPLSVHAKPTYIVRFFERADVRLLLKRLHVGHNIAWNGVRHVGVFTSSAQDALEGLQALLELFNAQAEEFVPKT